MKTLKTEAFKIESGPTESGLIARRRISPVGGEVLPVDKLSVFLSQYWILLLLILIPFSYILYKKRNTIPTAIYKLQTILTRLRIKF